MGVFFSNFVVFSQHLNFNDMDPNKMDLSKIFTSLFFLLSTNSSIKYILIASKECLDTYEATKPVYGRCDEKRQVLQFSLTPQTTVRNFRLKSSKSVFVFGCCPIYHVTYLKLRRK